MDKLKFNNSFLYKTGERIMPGAVSKSVLSEHYSRYYFALKYSLRGRVLNIASGCGYGSEVLKTKNNEIYNGDISENLVAYGNNRYGSYDNQFLKVDAEKMDFPEKFFDTVVSFETFEHIKNYKQFVKGIARVVKKGGMVVVSTPNKLITSPHSQVPPNPFHYKEWIVEDLIKEFKNDFAIIDLAGQHMTYPVQIDNSYYRNALYKIMFFLYNHTPSFIFKLLKTQILNYKDIEFKKIKILDKDKIFKTDLNSFNTQGHKQAYSVIILVLKRK